MKTVSAKKEEVTRKWYVVDAADKTLGRLSTEVANRLRGKHKVCFTPHVDTGDYIIIVNAEKIRVTRNCLVASTEASLTSLQVVRVQVRVCS